ncbi:hypothetical protein N431DRAFT_474442 [Stipitochalara longipes BDJ]|nr:hypothetical protein N431DRAFT_474442 [Stipitochalara longipes BDJ]
MCVAAQQPVIARTGTGGRVFGGTIVGGLNERRGQKDEDAVEAQPEASPEPSRSPAAAASSPQGSAHELQLLQLRARSSRPDLIAKKPHAAHTIRTSIDACRHAVEHVLKSMPPAPASAPALLFTMLPIAVAIHRC